MNLKTTSEKTTYSKNLNNKIFSVLLFIFCFSITVKSQTWVLEVNGLVMEDNKKLEGATVTLYKGSSKVQQIITSGNGKFQFNLEPDNDYLLTFTKSGYITKKISCSTKNVLEERGRYGFAPFKFELSIFKLIEGVDISSLLDKPIAKIVFDLKEDDFTYDADYTNSVKEQLAKIKEAEQAAQKYTAAISKADKAFAAKDYDNAKTGYNEAVKIKPMEQYPKEKLKEIDKLILEKDAKDAAEKELNAKYNAAISKADKLYGSKNYAGAKTAYNDASSIKPTEQYPKDKIKEIDKISGDIAAKEAAEKEKAAKEKELNDKYNAAIAKAEKAFTGKDYTGAKTAYNEASSTKPTEQYPKDKIKEIDKILGDIAAKEAAEKEKAAKEKELNDKYNAAIAKADKAFTGKDYTGAKTAYNDASGIKPTEQYPKDKIKEIDKLLGELAAKEAAEKEKAAKEKELNDKYNAAIAKADKAFTGKDYTGAKTAYNDASGIKPTEQYPKDKIKEIDKLLGDLAAKEAAEKEKAAKEKELNDKYNAAIAKADKAFTEKDYTGARSSYNEAGSIKPTEQYPKEKIKEIDKLLGDIAAKEAAEKEKAAKEKELNDKYNAAIAKADKAFTGKDYTGAKTAYNDASGIKPTEQYPKEKIKEIEKLLGDIAAKEAAEKEKEINDKYNAAIAKADKAFTAKDYSGARPSYSEASNIKPTEQYPKDKIKEIDKLLGDLAAKEAAEKEKAAKEKQQNDKYNAAIAKADKAFTGKDYTGARSSYNEAGSIKPTEQYPKDKIKEIDKLLGDLSAKDAAEKEKAAKEKEINDKYNSAITKADRAFAGKDYTGAKTAYSDASEIKPTEQYPKDKIKEIDKLLGDLVAKEAAEKEKAAKEKELNDKYNTVIAKADKSYTEKDYTGAKTAYNDASEIKSNEQYPKDKIKEIERILTVLAEKAAAKALAEKEKAEKEQKALQAQKNKPVKTVEQTKEEQPGISEEERKKQFINNLVLKYPQGVTEEIEKEARCTVTRRIVVKGADASVYTKKVWDWGGVYYFKDDIPISQNTFESETKK